MYGRKKVHYLGNPVNADLRGKIEYALQNATEKEREAARKDFLLIEAALLADRIVISLDDIARNLFARAAQTVGELRGFAWINPDQAEEEPILEELLKEFNLHTIVRLPNGVRPTPVSRRTSFSSTVPGRRKKSGTTSSRFPKAASSAPRPSPCSMRSLRLAWRGGKARGK
jgi:hypothetical protein